MPRPKLLPSQRQRAAEACNLCREAKRRCTGSVPCAHCTRRGLASSCVITMRPRGGGSRTGVASGSQRRTSQRDVMSTDDFIQGGDQQQQRATDSVRESGTHAPTMALPISPSESRTDQDGATSKSPRLSVSNTDLAPVSPHPRMLLNRRGERVFVGGAASISFLNVIRGVVADQIGPSPFSHNESCGRMMEAESRQEPDLGSPLATGLPRLTPETKARLMQSFFSVSEGFLDVFDPGDLELLLLPDDFPQNISPQRQASILLTIAIGAQCESFATAESIGQPFFRIAQALAFDDMLENPHIDMVRTFLLMAFYMLGACRRNAGFMYLGIATRAALALGLHCRESYDNMEDSQTHLRLRLWMSVRILDKLTNSILGRPSATAGVPSDLDASLEELSTTSQDSRTVCLIASHNIVSIINDIITTLYDWKIFTVNAVEERLRDLEQWKEQLPESLREATTSISANGSPGMMPSQGEVGRLHVSCLYYFAVTLATRPIMMSTLTSRPSQEDPRSHLATACLDAAMLLVQVCVEARDTGVLHGNMCILKALVFPAGLVLGFEIFAGGSVDYGIETAFHDAKEVLRYLAPMSPQAAHYVDILTSLSNAIKKHRSRPREVRRKSYVSKLFSFDVAKQTPDRPDNESTSEWTEDAAAASLFAIGNDLWSSSMRQMEPGDLFFDWESLNISQWDNFPFPASTPVAASGSQFR